MAMLEVKSVPNLLGTRFLRLCVKAGPWIFLTGHEAFDFERAPRGASWSIRLPAIRAAAQPTRGRFILQRMGRILREFGSDLGNGVRLDQYYPTPAAVDPYTWPGAPNSGD